MDKELAETIVRACERQGLKAELNENYSPSWMRGRRTAGVVIVGGDLAQVISAVIAHPQLFMEGEAPRFHIEEHLSVSAFRLNLILY